MGGLTAALVRQTKSHASGVKKKSGLATTGCFRTRWMKWVC